MPRPRARKTNARPGPKPSPARRSRRPARPSQGPVRTLTLAERPHAHIVCQQCGRITEILLTPAHRAGLLRLAGQRPGGWSVTRLAFSLTGLCPRCRNPLPTA